MPNIVRPLTQLLSVSANDLVPESLFETSIPAQVDEGTERKIRYVSRKVTEENLSKRIQNDVLSVLDKHNGLGNIRIDSLRKDVDALSNENVTINGTKTFTENPKIDNSVVLAHLSSQDNSWNDYAINFESLKKYTNIAAAPLVDSYSAFVTSLSGNNRVAYYSNYRIDASNRFIEKNVYDFILDTNVKNIAEYSFLFQIPVGATESNIWTAPIGGIFTCYGWLDELQNERSSNENRWVALLGLNENLGTWSILQLHPFDRNDRISYVGFTFPIKKGTKLKVQTGFAVGSNSDKYFAATGSVSNHLANAFLGGVYTSLSSLTDLGIEDFTHIENSLVALSTFLSNRIQDLCDHETECDLTFSENDKRHDDEIGFLSDEIDDRATIDDMNERSKFFGGSDTYPLDVTDDKEGLGIRRAVIRFGDSKEIYNGGHYGPLDPNGGVFQTCYDSATKKYYQNTRCIEIDWNRDWRPTELPFGVGQRIYDPPPGTTVSQIYGVSKTVEAAYVLDSIHPGSVFSDGMFMYYMVSQDSNVLINLWPDWSNRGGESTYCWILSKRANSNSYKTMIMTYLGSNADIVSGKSPNSAISLPLKKGTILMFGIYLRQKIPTPGLTHGEHLAINNLQMQGITNGPLAEFNPQNSGAYYQISSSYSSTGENGKTITYQLSTTRVNPDLTNLDTNFYNKADDASPFKYALSSTAFGTVATVVELP